MQVRLRAGGQVLHVTALLPEHLGTGAEPPPLTPGRPEPPARPESPSRPETPAQAGRPARALIALVEAVPARADELAVTIARIAENTGTRCALLGLERQNRLGARMGVLSRSPVWSWKNAAAELGVQQGNSLVVPCPEDEAPLESANVARVLQALTERADWVVVDLGCRWIPGLFRPVMERATNIWIVTRAGQWSGAEMRLEQAEFSGWTPMGRVGLVVMGEGLPVPGGLGGLVAGVLPEPGGQAACELVNREVGRVHA